MSTRRKPNKLGRALKTEPRLDIELTDEQKKVSDLIQTYDVVIVEGKWGTGKSMAAVATSIKEFRKKKFDRIVITRAFIPDKGLGALPGEIESKLIFEMQPILDNFETAQGKQCTDQMLRDGEIKIQYNGKVKGSTVSDAIYFIDEAQDLTWEGFKELFTRLGKTSKMIITLSKEQIHSSIGKESCYYKLLKAKDSGKVGWIEMSQTNHRNDIINELIDLIEDESLYKKS